MKTVLEVRGLTFGYDSGQLCLRDISFSVGEGECVGIVGANGAGKSTLIWCLLGLVSVLYFVFAELVKLHELCEWCTGVHILVFLSLLVTIARVQPARVSSRGL